MNKNNAHNQKSILKKTEVQLTTIKPTNKTKKRDSTPMKKKVSLNRTSSNVHNNSAQSRLYALMLKNPLDRGCYGVRGPTSGSIQTHTMHIAGRQTIASDSLGKFSFVWFGHPYLAMYDPQSLTSGPLTAYTSNLTVKKYITAANLQAMCNSFRVVGNGIILRNMLPINTLMGQLFAARVPMSKVCPGPFMLQDVTMTQSSILPITTSFELDSAGHIPTSIEALPNSFHVSAAEMCDTELKMSNVVTSDEAFQFHSTDIGVKYNSTSSIAQNILVNSTTGAVNAVTDNVDSSNYEGWSAYLVTGYGYPPSSNILEIEFGTHLEVVPAVTPSVDGGCQFVPDMSNTILRIPESQALALSNKCPLFTLSDIRQRFKNRG